MGLNGHPALGETPFFACRLRPDGDRLHVELAGEIDLSARSELDRLLGEASPVPPGGVVLDLTQVTFLDSTGLHWLLRARDAFGRDGGSLEVAVADGAVREVLAISGLDRLLPLAPSPAKE